MGSLAKAMGVDRLSVAERWQLVDEILDELATEPEILDIPQSHKDELDRRLAACETDPGAGSSWADVRLAK